MDDDNQPAGAVFRIFIHADIQRVWRELTKQGEPPAAVSICETGRPPVSTRIMHRLFDRMEFALPASTKSELWPLKQR